MTSSDYSGGSSGLTSLLPDSLYGSDFDSNAAGLQSGSQETKNGVDCIHYTAIPRTSAWAVPALASLGPSRDAWVPRPATTSVSGLYGYSASAGGQSRQLELLVRDHPRERRGPPTRSLRRPTLTAMPS